MRLSTSRWLAAVRWLVPAALLVLCPGAGHAQRVYRVGNVPLAHYNAPLATYPAPSYRAKDFTLVKTGGWYHLFYTRVQRYVPRHVGQGATQVLNETCFGHAISKDLEHWTELDTVLAIGPTTWERHHVWAPTLAQSGGLWWMFYAGITDSSIAAEGGAWEPRTQAICAAWSADPMLKTWQRVAQPVWSPCAGGGLPGVSWALCNPTLVGGTADCRDPFVMPPTAGSPAGTPWLLYYTARPRTDQYNYVIGVAQSPTGPGSAWSDVGALWDTYVPVENTKLESPHVFQHAGRWNLFSTGDDGTVGIQRFTALWPATGPYESVGSIIPSLDGKPDTPYLFPLDPAHWFASEYYGEDGPVEHADYFCFAHAYDVLPQYNPPGVTGDAVEPITDVEFRRMLWNADGSFDLSTPNPVRTLALSAGAATVGDTLHVTLTVNGAARQRADFSVVRVTGSGEVAVTPSAIGLPASATLVDGRFTINWPTKAGGLNLPANLIVRMGNQPMSLDAPVTLLPPAGGGDAAFDQLPVVRARPPSLAGGPNTLGDPTGAGGGGGTGGTGGSGGGSGGVSGGGEFAGPGPTALELRHVGAVPTSGGIGLLVGMPQAGSVRLDVYDVLGRHVAALDHGSLPSGYTLESWDGRDTAGHTVRNGMYFALLSTAQGRLSTRLLVLN